MIQQKRSDPEIINELYWYPLSRPVSETELEASLAHIKKRLSTNRVRFRCE